MASISRDGKGWLLQFRRDKRRHSVRLGKMPKKAAETVKTRVELLLAAKHSGEPLDGDTAAWVGNLGDTLHEKPARVGVVSARARATLGTFLDSFIAEREGTRKPKTVALWRVARRHLVEHFGADKPLRDISAGDADSWRAWLGGERGLAVNTANRVAGFAKQFFKQAVRLRLIPENPFADLNSSVRGTPENFRFVSRATVAAVLDAATYDELRLMSVLSRYGGFRTPSETFALRWVDVDWARDRVTIPSPKTAHHEGHESRTIPLFPELRPYLQAAFEAAKDGAVYVIAERPTQHAMEWALQRAIRAAGVEPWPRPWHNMRATRQSELAEQFPAHVVCTWMGNSRAVAREHYLHVTEEHFARATQGDAVLQKRMQHAPETPRNSPGGKRPTSEFPKSCGGLRYCSSVHELSGCSPPRSDRPRRPAG